MSDCEASAILRQARRRSGLSQAQLAQRARTTQSVVSAYESGARQPSLPMLRRLVAATGLELETTVRRPRRASSRLRGPLGLRLRKLSDEVSRVAGMHGVTNLRVFGSVARGEETEDSDIDLLVDVGAGVGLLGLARCQHELEAILGAAVDIVPARDLKRGAALSAAADALPI